MGLLLMVTHEDTAILNMSFIPSIVGNKKNRAVVVRYTC